LKDSSSSDDDLVLLKNNLRKPEIISKFSSSVKVK